MSSNNSRAAKTWSDNRHDAFNGGDVPIEDIDGVVAARRRPALVPSIGPESAREADHPPVSSWSVVFAYLMEGFVLYGASLHPNGFPVELPRIEDNVPRPADELSPPRERRAVVPNSASPTAAHIEQTSGDAGIALVDVGRLGSEGSASVGVVRRTAQKLRNLIARPWTDWRHEREIKSAVHALAEFDDRTLRDMGIRDRAQIEHTVRHGRGF